MTWLATDASGCSHLASLLARLLPMQEIRVRDPLRSRRAGPVTYRQKKVHVFVWSCRVHQTCEGQDSSHHSSSLHAGAQHEGGPLHRLPGHRSFWTASRDMHWYGLHINRFRIHDHYTIVRICRYNFFHKDDTDNYIFGTCWNQHQ